MLCGFGPGKSFGSGIKIDERNRRNGPRKSGQAAAVRAYRYIYLIGVLNREL